MKRSRTVFVVLMCVLVVGMSIANLLVPEKTFSDNENRLLKQRPEFSVKNFFSGDFDEQFETWFSDQFMMRDQWISIKAATKVASLAIENNGVYFGKKDTLIGSLNTINDRIVGNNITRINKFQENVSTPVHMMLIPTAVDINEENLPFGAYHADQKKAIQEVYDQLVGVDCIDIYSYLKGQQDIYFKSDHHWNEKGAYLGYSAICKEVLNKEPYVFDYELVSDDFKGTMYSKAGAFWMQGDDLYRYISPNGYSYEMIFEDGSRVDSLYMEENLSIKDKYTYYVDGNHSITTFKSSNTNHKKALVIKDSYAHILMPYLVEEYEEVIMIDLRYYRSSVLDLVDDATDIYLIYNLENFTADTNMAFLKQRVYGIKDY